MSVQFLRSEVSWCNLTGKPNWSIATQAALSSLWEDPGTSIAKYKKCIEAHSSQICISSKRYWFSEGKKEMPRKWNANHEQIREDGVVASPCALSRASHAKVLHNILTSTPLLIIVRDWVIKPRITSRAVRLNLFTLWKIDDRLPSANAPSPGRW